MIGAGAAALGDVCADEPYDDLKLLYEEDDARSLPSVIGNLVSGGVLKSKDRLRKERERERERHVFVIGHGSSSSPVG